MQIRIYSCLLALFSSFLVTSPSLASHSGAKVHEAETLTSYLARHPGARHERSQDGRFLFVIEPAAGTPVEGQPIPHGIKRIEIVQSGKEPTVNPHTEKPFGSFFVPGPYLHPTLSIAADGSALGVGADHKAFWIWDDPKGVKSRTHDYGEHRVTDLAISPDGKQGAVTLYGGPEHGLNVYDFERFLSVPAAQAEPVRPLHIERLTSQSPLVYDHEGRLYLGGNDGTVTVMQFNRVDGQLVPEQRVVSSGVSERVMSVVIVPGKDGGSVIAAIHNGYEGHTGSIAFWETLGAAPKTLALTERGTPTVTKVPRRSITHLIHVQIHDGNLFGDAPLHHDRYFNLGSGQLVEQTEAKRLASAQALRGLLFRYPGLEEKLAQRIHEEYLGRLPLRPGDLDRRIGTGMVPQQGSILGGAAAVEARKGPHSHGAGGPSGGRTKSGGGD